MKTITWPHNLKLFYDKLLEAASTSGFSVKILGKTSGDNPIYFLDRGVSLGPHILVASGFHGNESAGPWGIVNFLNKVEKPFISEVDISFIPLVNPFGFERDIRENEDGVDTNRGYIAAEERKDANKPLSKEGKILKNNTDLIVGSSKDGLLCLHEAPMFEKEFFVYGYEKLERPGNFTKLLRDLEAKYFSIYPDGLTSRGLAVTDGIIWKLYDGAFQDWLFRDWFTERAIVTETPKLNPFSYRVDVNSKIIETFINYFKLKR